MNIYFNLKSKTIVGVVLFVFSLSLQAVGQGQDASKDPKPSALINEIETGADMAPSDVFAERTAALKSVATSLETEQTQFLSDLASKVETVSKLRNHVNEVAKRLRSPDGQAIADAYSEAAVVWRSAAHILFNLFGEVDIDFATVLPAEAVLLSQDQAAQDAYATYNLAYETLKTKRRELSEERLKLVSDLRAKCFDLLRFSGTLRADLLFECDQHNCSRARGINEQNLSDLALEIKLVPFKVVSGTLSKIFEIKSRLTSGIDGWIGLAKQFFILLSLLLIPIALIAGLRSATALLERIRVNLVSSLVTDYRRKNFIANWISRLNPLIYSLGMILAIHVARGIIENTDLGELSKILFYGEAYFVYRLLRTVLAMLLEILFSTSSVGQIRNQKSKIDESAARISRILFFEFIFFHLTEDAVRKGFTYNILSACAIWANISFFIYESSQWKTEIVTAFGERFPKLITRIDLESSKAKSILFLPFMFAATAVYDLTRWLSFYLVRLDFVKRLLSDVLRKKLERVERDVVESYPLQQEYMNAFDQRLPASKEFYLESKDSPTPDVLLLIEQWRTGAKSDALSIVIGNRGTGKSTTLEEVNRRAHVDIKRKIVSVPPKILKTESLFKWMGELFGETFQRIEDIDKIDAGLKNKHLLMIDDIQNLFLAKNEGFVSYETFLEIISRKAKNIF